MKTTVSHHHAGYNGCNTVNNTILTARKAVSIKQSISPDESNGAGPKLMGKRVNLPV